MLFVLSHGKGLLVMCCFARGEASVLLAHSVLVSTSPFCLLGQDRETNTTGLERHPLRSSSEANLTEATTRLTPTDSSAFPLRDVWRNSEAAHHAPNAEILPMGYGPRCYGPRFTLALQSCEPSASSRERLRPGLLRPL